MQSLTTYTIVGSSFTGTMVFKYDLNGFLVHFELCDAQLDDLQRAWLYTKAFPYTEERIKHFYGIKNFTVTKGDPDLTFSTFFSMYKHKIKKQAAERAWKKLSKKDRINAIAGIKKYDARLFLSHHAKAAPSTYLNQRYWEDDL